MRDGWHKIANCGVYVESNRIVRGMRRDRNGSLATAYAYKSDGQHGWDRCSPAVSTFRRGIIHGTYVLY